MRLHNQIWVVIKHCRTHDPVLKLPPMRTEDRVR